MKYDWKNEEEIPEYPMDLEMGDCISFKIRRNGAVFYRLLLMRNKGPRNKDYPFVLELRTVDCGGTERAVERAYSKSLESLFDIAHEKARRLREKFEGCMTDRDCRSEERWRTYTMKENKGINEILNKLDSEDRERLASYISDEVRDALDEVNELENYEVLENDFWIEKLKPIEYMVVPRHMAKILLDLGFEHEAKGGQTLEGPYNEDVFSNTLQEGSIKIRYVSSPTNRYIEVSIAKDSSTGSSFRFPLTPRNTLLFDNPSVIEFVRIYSVSNRMKEVDADDDVDYKGSSFAVYFSINRKNRSYWLRGVSEYKDKILFSYVLK